MAGSVNKVILVGNVGKDPEIRTTQAGDAIASFSVATSESWKDRNSGERVERTEWHRVVIFNPHLAKVVQDHLRKGAKVYVEGQMKTRKWTDQSGQDRYSTEVVLDRFRGDMQMLSSARTGPDADSYGTTSRGAGAGDYSAAKNGSGATANRDPEPADLDDEIPF